MFTYSTLVLLAALAAAPSLAAAQAKLTNPDPEQSLAEDENDPTAALTQFQVKDIFTPAEYGTDAEPNTVQIRTIAAISPFSLIPFEQLVRPTIKVVTTPVGNGSTTGTGLDDMQLLDLFVMPWPSSDENGLRWGVGPYFIFPTSTTKLAGDGAWQMGPALGFSYRGIPGFNLGGLGQQATSFAYTSSRSVPQTSITFQPIISYQLGHGWYIKSSDATWKFNLRHNTSTTIPLSFGIGKVWKLERRYAIDTSVSGEWTAYRQLAEQTEQSTVNFQLTLLLPNIGL